MQKEIDSNVAKLEKDFKPNLYINSDFTRILVLQFLLDSNPFLSQLRLDSILFDSFKTEIFRELKSRIAQPQVSILKFHWHEFQRWGLGAAFSNNCN